MEMLVLLRSGQKERSKLRTHANILKKSKREVRDNRGKQRGKYLCKRCTENEEVYTHYIKCCGEGNIARKSPSSQKNGRGLRN